MVRMDARVLHKYIWPAVRYDRLWSTRELLLKVNLSLQAMILVSSRGRLSPLDLIWAPNSYRTFRRYVIPTRTPHIRGMPNEQLVHRSSSQARQPSGPSLAVLSPGCSPITSGGNPCWPSQTSSS